VQSGRYWWCPLGCKCLLENRVLPQWVVILQTPVALLDLSSLESLVSDDNTGLLSLFGAFNLQKLAVPKLTTVDIFYLDQNEELQDWDLSGLTDITTEITITKNPKLPSCLVDHLVNQVQFSGPKQEVDGLKQGCNCNEIDGKFEAVCP